MRPLLSGLGAWSLVALIGGAAAAYPRPGSTVLVSPGTTAGAFMADVSADGRYVAFVSDAEDIVPGDVNRRSDVFVRDLRTGGIELVSVAVGGGSANGHSTMPSISADGRHVAFASEGTNLAFGDTDGWEDVFVRDRQTGVTEQVSLGVGGAEPDGASGTPHVSADGRFVVFTSSAQNLVPGDVNAAGVRDVFLRDRETGTTELISVSSTGQQALGLGTSDVPQVSADGRSVVFESIAENLVADDRNKVIDVFVRDRATGTTARVSVAPGGAEGNGESHAPSISDDGRSVAFWSTASNLVPRDTNGLRDAFVRDMTTGRVERVSVSSSGLEHALELPGETLPLLAPDWHPAPAISADGRYVAFVSGADNVTVDDMDTVPDVFVHDRVARSTEWVSGPAGPSAARGPSISMDGSVVVFADGDRIGEGDGDDHGDVFARRRGPSVGIAYLIVAPGGAGVQVEAGAGLSGAVVSGTGDGPADAVPGAAQLGGELVGASLVYRPEQEDLLARIEVSALPATRLGAPGAPLQPPGQLSFLVPSETASPLLHGISFVLDGTRYEVRAIRTNVEEAPPTEPLISLWRCNPSCSEIRHLSGAYGETGDEIVASVPLRVSTSFRADPGDALSSVRAYAALGEPLAGPQVMLDEATLPDGTLPRATAFVGLAPAGTPELQVDFVDAGQPHDGRFTGFVPTNGLPPGAYEVWARACMGPRCGALSTALLLV